MLQFVFIRLESASLGGDSVGGVLTAHGLV